MKAAKKEDEDAVMVFITVNVIKCLTGQEVFGSEWSQLRRQGYLWQEEGPRW